MAEALFFFLVQKIVSALGDEAAKQVSSLLGQELTQLTQVRSRMNQIKSEFEVIQAFLSYMGSRKENNQILEAWVKQVREVAFEAEDIMDRYTYLLADQHQSSSKSLTYKIFHHSSNFGSWQHIANQLEEILNRLHHLRDMKDRYGIKTIKGENSNTTHERQQNLAVSSHFIDDDELVGIKKNKKLLVEWLMDKEPQCRIISVWGMAGLGKTILVSKVYRSKIIKAQFDCHAWISVSQSYQVDDLLRRIVGQFFKDKEGGIPQHIDTLDHTTLIKILRDYLQGKRYILILDDVWSTDVWADLRDILDNNQASRIVVTTRHHNVASLAAKNHVMKLELLSTEDAWSLFCKKAFWKVKDRKCPSALESQAKEIVNKCNCLPLAIVALGNLLSLRGKKELEWIKVLDDINWELNNNPELDLMKSILALSLKELPEHLKNCFLYCGIFPEDYPIKRKKLIRLWIAEGFIKKRGRRTMEEVAEDNLNELVHRCMLQVAERNDFGRVKACKMNAIMRELTLSVSEKEEFYVVCENPEASFQGEARRLSVHRCGNNIQLSERSMLHLRSFMLFDTILFPLKFSFKLLRVLDMQGVPLETLPHEVYNLFNLHYLGLRNTKIRKISKSIKKLINLQTLDLAYTQVRKLPDGITELKKLRHLFVHTIGDQTHKSFSFFSGFPAPRGIWDLKDLQTLQGVEARKRMVRNLMKMPQLKTFRIMKVKGIHCMDLSAAIRKMNRLQRLDIVAAEEKEALNLQDMLVPPQHLRKLTIRAKLEYKVLPTWFGFLNHLTWLRLNWSGLEEDPLPCIGKLPSLVFLLLLKAYDGQSLSFRAGCFPKLKDLRLIDMDNLQQVEIEHEALTKLCQLNLVRCGALKEVPQGIDYLSKLEMLYLEDMPKEFINGLQSRIQDKLEGSVNKHHGKSENDCTKVLHIPPIITHVFQKEGRWCGESLRDPSFSDSLYEEEQIAVIKGEMERKEERYVTTPIPSTPPTSTKVHIGL